MSSFPPFPGPVSGRRPAHLRTTPAMPYTGESRLRLLAPNFFDLILLNRTQFWQLIQSHGGLEQVRFRTQSRHQYPIYKTLWKRPGSIALPAPNGLDTTVFTFTVPVGYRIALTSLTHGYTAGGFVEGSGDLTWRIRINQYYPITLGTMRVTMGSLQTPEPLPQGSLVLDSGDILTYQVNHAAASLLVGGNIFAMVTGYLYPRD